MRRIFHKLTQHHFQDADAYDRRAGAKFRRMYQRVAEDVAAVAPKGGVVLDAGCGTGQLAAEIARRRPDLQIHGVDLEPAMVSAATRRAEREDIADRVRFTAADLADLPLPDGAVDMVVSTASMHHWADARAVVTALDRVLKPGGPLWIYDLRFAPGGAVRSASTAAGRRVDRVLVRTGRLPVALFQRLALEPSR